MPIFAITGDKAFFVSFTSSLSLLFLYYHFLWKMINSSIAHFIGSTLPSSMGMPVCNFLHTHAQSNCNSSPSSFQIHFFFFYEFPTRIWNSYHHNWIHELYCSVCYFLSHFYCSNEKFVDKASFQSITEELTMLDLLSKSGQAKSQVNQQKCILFCFHCDFCNLFHFLPSFSPGWFRLHFNLRRSISSGVLREICSGGPLSTFLKVIPIPVHRIASLKFCILGWTKRFSENTANSVYTWAAAIEIDSLQYRP